MIGLSLNSIAFMFEICAPVYYIVIFTLQVEDFMKPYSDEPENSPTFLGAYRDQEDED